MKIINTTLIASPYNWIVVALMLLLAGFGYSFVSTAATQGPAQQ